MHTRIRVLGRRALRVYFGSDISELHCIKRINSLLTNEHDKALHDVKCFYFLQRKFTKNNKSKLGTWKLLAIALLL